MRDFGSDGVKVKRVRVQYGMRLALDVGRRLKKRIARLRNSSGDVGLRGLNVFVVNGERLGDGFEQCMEIGS